MKYMMISIEDDLFSQFFVLNFTLEFIKCLPISILEIFFIETDFPIFFILIVYIKIFYQLFYIFHFNLIILLHILFYIFVINYLNILKF